MIRSASIRCVLFAAASGLLLCGCGDSVPRTVVKGQLYDNGKPFKLDVSKVQLPKGATAAPPTMGGGGLLRVIFIPVEGGDSSQAVVDTETGAFTVAGPDGKGIKLGQYKIAVTAKSGGADYFNGRFSPETTPFKREVKPGEEILLDLARP
ncbi:MAG TPA: hypothetical protein VGL71_06435 [Urbifossiella sp.]|jgi:hypothetical protein